MDASRFDTVVKEISASRRYTFKAILSGAVAALVSLQHSDQAAANCKKVGRKCERNNDCCNGATCKGGQNGKCRCKNGFDDCDGDGRCESLADDPANCGACGVICGANTSCCDSVCIDIQSDPANCGACAAACNSGEACAAGTCITCLPSAPLCGARCCAVDSCCLGICVDLQTSRANCGSCFTLCDFDETCIAGKCITLL